MLKLNRSEQKLWQSMLERSFEPRQWFDDWDDLEPSNYPHDQPAVMAAAGAGESKRMWVYRRVVTGEGKTYRYVVGFFAPNATWNQDSIYDDTQEGRQLAANRVHWLNGGESH